MYDFDGYDLDIEDIVMDYIVKNHLKNFKGFTYQSKMQNGLENTGEEKNNQVYRREYPTRNIKTVDSEDEFL